jgi:hypothetical protein
MALPRINGTLQPIRTSLRSRFDPSRGFVVVEEWESAGNNLNGLASQARANQVEYEHTANDHRSRLMLTSTGAAAGYAEEITDNWQLSVNLIQRDIKDHPTVLAFPATGAGSLSETLAFVEAFKRGNPPEEADFASNNQFYLFRLLIHGTTSYTVDQHVVRHVFNAPIQYAGAVEFSEIPFLMDDRLDAIPVNGPNDGVQFKWGWKRTGYSYSVGANNRVEVTTEWQLASWSLLIYSAGSITTSPT